MIKIGVMKNKKKEFNIQIQSLDPTGVVVSTRKMSFETNLPVKPQMVITDKGIFADDEPMRSLRYLLTIKCYGVERQFFISPDTLELEEIKHN